MGNFGTASQSVLITGGTRGIGACMVDLLVAQGVTRIAVIARTTQALAALEDRYPAVGFITMAGDVGDISVIRSMIDHIGDAWGHLDLLINNAAILAAGPLDEQPDHEIVQQVNINLTAVMLLTKYAIPLLKKSKEAGILNISSGLGLMGMPFYSVYGATKAALKHFSDSTRRELAPFDIHVTCAYPTATDTHMMRKFPERKMDSPEYVAKRALKGYYAKELHVIFGGAERKAHNALNFMDPDAFDGIVAKGYDDRKTRSLDHKAL